MFDVGFAELVLLFVIGLLILGPERLPRVASQIGRWVGRARRTASQLRHQLEREIALNDIRHPPTKKPAPPKDPEAPKDTGPKGSVPEGSGSSPASPQGAAPGRASTDTSPDDSPPTDTPTDTSAQASASTAQASTDSAAPLKDKDAPGQ